MFQQKTGRVARLDMKVVGVSISISLVELCFSGEKSEIEQIYVPIYQITPRLFKRTVKRLVKKYNPCFYVIVDQTKVKQMVEELHYDVQKDPKNLLEWDEKFLLHPQKSITNVVKSGLRIVDKIFRFAYALD